MKIAFAFRISAKALSRGKRSIAFACRFIRHTREAGPVDYGNPYDACAPSRGNNCKEAQDCIVFVLRRFHFTEQVIL
jgi:hypothetical protein